MEHRGTYYNLQAVGDYMNITKRSDGRFQSKIKISKGQYKIVYGKTEKEVREKAKETERRIKQGIITDETTVSDYIEYYCDLLQDTKTAGQYQLIKARLQVVSHYIGNKSLYDIRKNDVQIALNKIAQSNPYTGKPSSIKTMTDYRREAFNLFENAVDNDYIEKNPAKNLSIPKIAEKPKERRALTEEERDRIVNFKHRAQLPLMIMLFSGLRKGELTALKWSDIDLDRKTISVTKSYDFKQHTVKSPKNGKSRLVFIPDILVDFLIKQPNKDGFVVASAHNKMMTLSAWDRLLESYLCDVNASVCDVSKFSPYRKMLIEPFTYHCLRHTYCTMLYEAGVDVLTAQQQMGHSSPEITLRIYTHLGEKQKQLNVEKLNEYLN